MNICPRPIEWPLRSSKLRRSDRSPKCCRDSARSFSFVRPKLCSCVCDAHSSRSRPTLPQPDSFVCCDREVSRCAGLSTASLLKQRLNMATHCLRRTAILFTSLDTAASALRLPSRSLPNRKRLPCPCTLSGASFDRLRMSGHKSPPDYAELVSLSKHKLRASGGAVNAYVSLAIGSNLCGGGVWGRTLEIKF